MFYSIQIINNPGLTGEIPFSIGQLSNLQNLDLSHNKLSGSIPSSIGQMTNLIFLNVGKNLIENLPFEIINCKRLKYLYFENNKISEMPDLTELDSIYLVIANNNKLEFDDIIPLVGRIPSFNYSPQDSIGVSEVFNNLPGEYFSHSLFTGGQQNNYQWYKDGFNIYSKTSPTLEISKLYFTDSGKYYCKVTNSMAPELILTTKIKTLKVEYPDCPQHFKKVWVGNGYEHMGILVFDANIDGIELEQGDEIGVFDGEFCVGFGKLTKAINYQNLLEIVVSKNDGSGNGYKEGHEIIYRIWDCSAGSEYIVDVAQYTDNMGNSLNNQPFKTGATAFVELSAINRICQTLSFNPGWNLCSIPLELNPAKTQTLFQSLITNNSLVKIQDGLGNSIENWGIFGGWQDNIGDVFPSEGYKIKVSITDSVEFCGTPVDYPYPIPLNAGWNIMGYPQTKSINGLSILQQLIDRGTLLKTQDDLGNSIEDWGIFGGWQNNIGNFAPGEGYKIKVFADDTLWIYESYPKSTSIQPALAAVIHFHPAFEGNGVDHMNINLVSLPTNMLKVGDELAVFDGTTCVGAVTLMSHHIKNQSVSITASAKDNQGMAGFGEGNQFTLKLWKSRNNQEFILEPEIVKGTSTFTKHETTIASLEKYATTSLDGLPGLQTTETNCYPNPFSDEVTIEIRLLNDSEVEVEVLNQLGQRVKMITTKQLLPEGLYKLTWDGRNAGNGEVAPGIYHLRIEINGEINFKKVVYSKIE